VDRVDALRGGSIGVVDYKTGTSDGYKKTSFRGGRQLQLPIYLLAASHLLKASAGSARYLFVRQPRDMVQFTLAELRQRTDDLRRTLRIIVEAIAAGDFFPLPPDDGNGLEVCERRCPYDVACGAARGYLAEMKRTDPDAARLAELRQIE
jgi:RecB family exonuclease